MTAVTKKHQNLFKNQTFLNWIFFPDFALNLKFYKKFSKIFKNFENVENTKKYRIF